MRKLLITLNRKIYPLSIIINILSNIVHFFFSAMTNKSPGHQVVAAGGSCTANFARASLPVQHYRFDIPFTVSIAWSAVVSKPLLALHE